jgi:vacuolar-type H+-ATPase subunit H
MAKKDIEEAIKEAHEMADEAIDELQEEIEDARTSVMEWLKTEHTFTQAEILLLSIGVVAVIATVGVI